MIFHLSASCFKDVHRMRAAYQQTWTPRSLLNYVVLPPQNMCVWFLFIQKLCIWQFYCTPG